MVNSDAVVRTCFCNYHHPKECLVNDGVLCKDLLRAAKAGPARAGGGAVFLRSNTSSGLDKAGLLLRDTHSAASVD